jgi:hypothetical protein
VSLNRLDASHGGVRHSGDREGLAPETLTIDFSSISSTITAIVISLHTNEGGSMRPARGTLLSLSTHGNTQIFRMTMAKGSALTGFMALAFLRHQDIDWNIVPVNRFTRSRNPSEMRPFALDFMKSLPGYSLIDVAPQSEKPMIHQQVRRSCRPTQ